jgi:hypothetical protein
MRFPPKLASLGLGVALAAAGLCLGTPFFGTSLAAETQLTADEYGLKAAFLYNLAKFVDWPPSKFKQDDAPLVIGVTGQDAFDRAKAIIRDKTIEKHKVVIRLLASEAEIPDCHILFLTRSQKQRAAEMVNAANKAAVLTVGETEEFLEAGGMIRFYIVADNLRLEIADESVRAAGLNIKATALSTLINKAIARLRKL